MHSDEPFEQELERLTKELKDQFAESARLEREIRTLLSHLTP